MANCRLTDFVPLIAVTLLLIIAATVPRRAVALVAAPYFRGLVCLLIGIICTFGFWVFYFLLNFLASGQVSKCERCMLGIYTSSSTATVSASMGIILPFLVGKKKIAALQLRQGTDLPVRICFGSMLRCSERSERVKGWKEWKEWKGGVFILTINN